MTIVYGPATATALLVAGALLPFLYRMRRANRPMRLRAYRRYWTPILLAGAIASVGVVVVAVGPAVTAVARRLGMYTGGAFLSALLILRLPPIARRVVLGVVIVVAGTPFVLLADWETPPAVRTVRYDGSLPCDTVNRETVDLEPGATARVDTVAFLLKVDGSRESAEPVGRCVSIVVASVPEELWWIGRRPLVRRRVPLGPAWTRDVVTAVESLMVRAGLVRTETLVVRFGTDSRFVPRGRYTLLIDVLYPSDM